MVSIVIIILSGIMMTVSVFVVLDELFHGIPWWDNAIERMEEVLSNLTHNADRHAH